RSPAGRSAWPLVMRDRPCAAGEGAGQRQPPSRPGGTHVRDAASVSGVGSRVGPTGPRCVCAHDKPMRYPVTRVVPSRRALVALVGLLAATVSGCEDQSDPAAGPSTEAARVSI